MFLLMWIAALILLLVVYFSYKYAWWKPTVAWEHPRVLMYHMVRNHIPDAKFNKLRVSPQAFEEQIAWMDKQGFNFVTMHELQQNWGRHPTKTVAITFDDGYLDNLENAFPILKKYQAKATIYVVVDRHERDWSTYKKAHHNSGELMLEPKLSDSDVQQLANTNLIEIGSHTLTHANLDKLSDEECLIELMDSKRILEQLIAREVSSFAYPFGIYSERDVKLVKQVGYDNAVTTVEGVDQDNPDFMQLKRIKISGKDSLFSVKLRLRLGRRNG